MSSKKKHMKHPKLARPSMGILAKRELSILGANCDVIEQIATNIQSKLSQYKITYYDTDHHADPEEKPSGYGKLINKKSYLQHSFFADDEKFSLTHIFNDLDLLLINGNHQIGERQIVVIDSAKDSSLKKRISEIGNVVLVLIKDNSEIPQYITELIDDSTPIIDLLNEGKWIAVLDNWMLEMRAPIQGLILNGGRSTRMGTDKSKLIIGGKSMLKKTHELIDPLVNSTYYSIRKDQVDSYEDKDVIVDRLNEMGPYGGILSAFMHNPDSAWLVIAVDMPNVKASDIEKLISSRDSSKVATAFYNPETGFPDPLLTIWEPKAYLHLLGYMSLGYTCPRKVLINSDIAIVDPSGGSVLANMNSPEDYKSSLEGENDSSS